jgi:hypothetical protein
MADTARDAACRAARSKVPALAGVQPEEEPSAAGRVFVFRVRRPGPGGRPLAQVVRVTVSPDGRVLKLTTSR